MTPEQIEAERIKAMFPILNHVLKMKNVHWSIVHVKDLIEILYKFGFTTNIYEDFETGKQVTVGEKSPIEFYERVLKILEDGNLH